MSRFAPLIALLLTALTLASCGECDDAPAAATFTPTHRVTTSTVYYLTGPQQASPPDGTMEAGAPVRLVEEAGSYVRVETKDGTQAYVAADAIEALAP